MGDNIKKLTFTGLFTALAIIIPTIFKPFQIVIGPFSMTPASHLPVFLAMLISPGAAIAVGGGSTIGFLLSGTPIHIVARAAMHMIVGGVGAYLIQKGISFKKMVVITAPIHAVTEAIAVAILPGFDIKFIILTVAIGTLVHHCMDGVISGALIKALSKAMRKDLSKGIFLCDKKVA